MWLCRSCSGPVNDYGVPRIGCETRFRGRRCPKFVSTWGMLLCGSSLSRCGVIKARCVPCGLMLALRLFWLGFAGVFPGLPRGCSLIHGEARWHFAGAAQHCIGCCTRTFCAAVTDGCAYVSPLLRLIGIDFIGASSPRRSGANFIHLHQRTSPYR